MIDLQDEGNFMGILTGNRAQHAQGGGYRITAAFDGQLDDIFRIEIDRVRRKRSPGGVLDALIHRQDGDITGFAQAAVVKKGLQIPQGGGVTVRNPHYPVHKIRSRQMQLFFRYGFTFMVEKRIGLIPQ